MCVFVSVHKEKERVPKGNPKVVFGSVGVYYANAYLV